MSSERRPQPLSAPNFVSADGNVSRRRDKPPRKLLFGVIGVLALAGIATAYHLYPSRQSASASFVLHEVRRGTLPIEVTERGNLESAHNVEHFCEVEGRSGGRAGGTAILWIAPAGTEVKKGDLLVTLESSYLEDMEKSQRIAYNTTLSSVAKARADVDTAKKTIKEYEEGVFVQQFKLLQSDVTVAEESSRRAQNNLRYTEKLYLNGFVNKLDVEAAQFAVRNAQLTVDKAKTALDVLLRVTKEKTLTHLRGDLESKEAILKSEEDRLAQEKARHERMTEQLQKCKILAKADGMVVYFEKPGRFGPDEEDKIREGAVVRERQKLIILPDLKKMRVRVLVNESKIDMVRKSQPVLIRIDAFSERVINGHVEIIGAAPEPGVWFDRDKRNYPVTVSLDESPDGLKPGMTAQATILIDKRENVLTVPVNCVRTAAARTSCYVLKPDGTIEERQVTLGPNNDRFVEVAAGLSQGEQVIQSPEAALQLKGQHSTAAAETGKQPDVAADQNGPPSEDKGPPPDKGPKGKGKATDAEDKGPPPGKGPKGKGKGGDEEDAGPPPGKGPKSKGADEEDQGPPPGKGPKAKGKGGDDEDAGPPPGKGKNKGKE